MYEVGQYIGSGGYSVFFRLRDHPRLGVKILHFFQYEKPILETELQKGRILRELGLPVPKYVAVMQVKIPSYFQQTIEKKISRMTNEDDKADLHDKVSGIEPASIRWGLIMEIIENDLSLVSKARIKYFYQRERKRIESIGITIDDAHSDNVLWSPSAGKLYFIDFQFWGIPNKINRP